MWYVAETVEPPTLKMSLNAILDEQVTFSADPAVDELGPVLPAEENLFAELLHPNRSTPAPLRRGLNYSHDAMLDAILANPGITQNELATTFGYTASWISQVINSDAFKARLAARTHELRDPVIVAAMEEQFAGILSRGLELTRQRLDSDKVSDNFILRSVEMSSRALGYGAAKKDDGRNPGVEEKLADLSNNLVNLLHAKKRAAVTFEDGEVE